MQIKLGDISAQGTENAISVLSTDLEQLIRERYDWLKWTDIICSQHTSFYCCFCDIHDYLETHIHCLEKQSEFN
jgi:hypothetical protein